MKSHPPSWSRPYHYGLRYVVDTSLPYGCVVEEYAGASTIPSARYDYGDDLVRMDRGGVYYYIYDGLGSTRQLVSTTGAVTDSYGYSAFGEMASRTGTGTTPTVNPFLFNAQQFDGASGDYYLRARYYDQSNGRFISQDPFEGRNDDPVSLHRYLYANADPVNYIDPTGKDSLVETIVTFAVINIIRYSTLVTVGRFGLAALTLYGIATKSESAQQFYALSSGLPGGPGGALAGLVGEASGVSRLFSLTEDIASGTVAQNGLDEAEFAQAQLVADFRGGHFEGQPVNSGIPGKLKLPGFDGYINGEPASLKYTDSDNPFTVLSKVGENDRKLEANTQDLIDHGYLKPGEQVEVFVIAPNINSENLADFASKGALSQIPGRGRISGITIKTADGWLRISTR